jgi:hypothetical protein
MFEQAASDSTTTVLSNAASEGRGSTTPVFFVFFEAPCGISFRCKSHEPQQKYASATPFTRRLVVVCGACPVSFVRFASIWSHKRLLVVEEEEANQHPAPCLLSLRTKHL